MRNTNVIIIAAIAIILVLAGIIISMDFQTSTTNTTDNDTINLTINETSNNTQNNTTNTETKTSTKKTTKNKNSEIVSESIQENYQAGDGSHYRQVEYKDGNIRQYDTKGKLIGSTYDSDQAQLKKDAGADWMGD